MGNKRKITSLLAVMLAGILLCTGPAAPLATSVYAAGDEVEDVEEYAGEDETEQETETPAKSNETSKLEAELDQVKNNLDILKQEKEQLKASINSVKNAKDKAQAKQDAIYTNIRITQGEISLLEQRVTLLEEDIVEKQAEIKEKQTEIDANYKLFKKRLRAKYVQDKGTVLGLLLGADNFADYLTRSEYVVRIAQHDRDLVDNLTEERISIEEDKAQLEDSKQQVLSDKSTTETKKLELDSQHSEAAAQVQDVARQEAEYLADMANIQAQEKKAQAAMDDLFRKIEFSKNPYSGGVMHYPLPGFYTRSSPYGPRFGGSNFHTGCDFTGGGCYGATIQAANDGIVSVANTAYSQGSGYGIFVIIDHGTDENGNNISTLYAHCSSLLVSVGQQVKRGDAIAKVGSTGWSTGPHLHFEVRVNGSHVEPTQYL